MKKLYFSKNVVIVVVVDALLFCCAFYLAYLLRFDFHIPRFYRVPFQQVLPLVILLKLASFYWFDLYRGMWRYTSLSDLFNIVKAALITNLVIVGGLLFFNRFQGFPRSVFLIDALLTILTVSGFRILIRIYFEHAAGDKMSQVVKKAFSQVFSKTDGHTRRVIILGAGDCGEKIYREIAHNPSLGFQVVGFLDDNPVKVGKKIHGLPVLGEIAGVSKFVARLSIDELIIAIPTATPEQMRTIVALCEKSGIPYKTVPGFSELLNGTPSVAALRKVAYRDLLGREVVRLDKEGIGAYLAGKTVLVTGAGGSIGSELCRQILEFSPGRIVLFDRSETALYEIDLELKGQRRDTGLRISPVLGDIQDQRQLEHLFQLTAPHVVFHAAAYKHVPMLEAHPWKAVKNNIIGTRNLVELSKRFAVERFVLVSTDKAVRPANVMGASKRVAELLLQCGNGGAPCTTQFMIVRFGNVLGSAGSVIPLFQKQIGKGGPVTVTHPEVTRFFMTVSEACQLILQAGAIGNTGRGRAEVFVLKMGTPVKIVDMARDLIRLSGLEPDKDISIEFVGLRPGEKLYEELIVEGEGVVPTEHEKIMVLRGAEAHAAVLNGAIEELERSAELQDGGAIRVWLKKIVPEYEPA
ncbi:polysaccharide biosynthesis protein [Desulfosudis oleivorans]|uniref:Polysaccharide biosynthesis protein CapD n=1 Tax=Desulfosudis oleivorans (strain DSM 6200 / JCM 39069 / Hxd3) TaxID=96561 RepID=A8ZWL1_DESOH|nr:nucleoside-diphosphate sugar epimerase/dehydratase [Desulfosudis oleivorans]ABW66819.1 polysaccharide biosynthesis protein CapD [Desulfosudis oleivorans Hxd3]